VFGRGAEELDEPFLHNARRLKIVLPADQKDWDLHVWPDVD
jgi:hypothetical protein